MTGRPVAAVTGATGFAGRHLLGRLLAEGYAVRALARTLQSSRDGITWVTGDLSDRHALERLVGGAAVTFHLAGAIKALTAGDFYRINADGTRRLTEAMARTGARRLVHVSTLAARVPRLSDYAASKAQSEALVMRSDLDWTIIRPPGVYGPGDRETLTFFRLARGRLMPLPNPQQRLSLIHVSDLAGALVAAARPEALWSSYEVADGAIHTLAAVAGELAHVMGGSGRIIAVPRLALAGAAGLAQIRARLTGSPDILTPGKVAELYHPDWSVSDAGLHRATGWSPAFTLPAGLAATAQWYRAQDWL